MLPASPARACVTITVDRFNPEGLRSPSEYETIVDTVVKALRSTSEDTEEERRLVDFLVELRPVAAPGNWEQVS